MKNLTQQAFIEEREAALLIEIDGSEAKIKEDNEKLFKVLEESGSAKNYSKQKTKRIMKTFGRQEEALMLALQN